MSPKNNKKVKNRNVTLKIFLLVCVVFNGLISAQGGYLYPPGSGYSVSDKLKSEFFLFFCFDFESPSGKVRRKWKENR
jgi:hypothetical protein